MSNTHEIFVIKILFLVINIQICVKFESSEHIWKPGKVREFLVPGKDGEFLKILSKSGYIYENNTRKDSGHYNRKKQIFCRSLHFADIGQGISMKTIQEKIVDITTEKTNLL